MSLGRTLAALVVVMIGCQESSFAPTDDALGPQFFHGAAPGIGIVSASALTLTEVCRGGFGEPQCLARPYDTAGNLAFQGNGFAQPAVARDNLSVAEPQFSAIHQPEFANDGLYGNGSSWIVALAQAQKPNSWLKIDLGRPALIDEIRFGRDRLGGFNDRDPGQFTIAVATSENVYANGDETNDGNEYVEVFNSTDFSFSGSINGAETVQASFAQVLARFIKITVASGEAAVDEVEVTGILQSYGELCALVQSFVSHAGVANSMCAKVGAAERADARGQTRVRDNNLSAFINEVEAQTGKRVAPGDAAVLIALATALMS